MAKLDNSGVLQWHTFLGSSSGESGQSIVADPSGNLYITGESDAGWGSPINAHVEGNDVFVAKLNVNGVLQWHTFLGSSSDDEGYSVDADGSGNLYVTGESDAGWGSPINAHAGSDDAFVAKLDNSGVLQWHTFLGSSDGDLGSSVAADGSGNLYVTGHSKAGWGSPINSYAGSDDAFVAKIYDLDIEFALAEIISTSSSGIRYWDVAEEKWTQMTSSIPTGDIASSDFTGDGKAEVASCWSSGLWYQDGATFDWTKVSNTAPAQLTAGDVTGQ